MWLTRPLSLSRTRNRVGPTLKTVSNSLALACTTLLSNSKECKPVAQSHPSSLISSRLCPTTRSRPQSRSSLVALRSHNGTRGSATTKISVSCSSTTWTPTGWTELCTPSGSRTVTLASTTVSTPSWTTAGTASTLARSVRADSLLSFSSEMTTTLSTREPLPLSKSSDSLDALEPQAPL